MGQNQSRSLHLSITGHSDVWTWQIRSIPDPISKNVSFPNRVNPELIQGEFEKVTNPLDIYSIKKWAVKTGMQIFPQELLLELQQLKGGDILFQVPVSWSDIPFELLYLNGRGYLGTIFLIGTVISMQYNGWNEPRKSHPIASKKCSLLLLKKN